MSIEQPQKRETYSVRLLVTEMARCRTDLCKTYSGNADIREWLDREMFRLTYLPGVGLCT